MFGLALFIGGRVAEVLRLPWAVLGYKLVRVLHVLHHV